MKVGIVGAGMIGRAWAIVFARQGFETRIWDSSSAALKDALAAIQKRLGDIEQVGLIEDSAAAWQCVRPVDDLEQTVNGVDFVQENLPESVEVKCEIFAKLDRLAQPTAILASSTSALPASLFTEHLTGRGRCLVAHPANPPYLIPLVELCGAPWTEPATIEQAAAIYRRLGQRPIVIRREIPGFVLNRLQGALLSEAFRLVESGVVLPEEVDIAVKHGLGLRWSFMGPFETIDLNAPGGVRDYCERYGPIYSLLRADAPSPEPWSEALVARLEETLRRIAPLASHLARQAWRDQRLMQLAAHKHQMEQSEASKQQGIEPCHD
jgi:3-hydroxyacyl-CoA dehydrogenase